jgi:L,D-peptidoglycan transpeptidase YkuD (ErfK/YbiS/YcfS/YnhG family)
MGRSWTRAGVILLSVVLVAACGSTSPQGARDGPTTVAVPAADPPPGDAPPPTRPPSRDDLPDPRLAEAGAAGQVVVVTAARYGATTATLTAWEREGGGWRRAFGPWTARVGTRGVAPPGEKREGDGRTPSGAYGFDFFFGVEPDPGVSFPHRRITGRSIVWDDDPASPLYNTWVDLDRQQAGAEPEPMYNRPAYDHGAVIAYNAARTPGLGSAIFLHVSTGTPTAGCVSLPLAQLLDVLRWLDPGRDPRIVIGAAG